MLINDSTEPDNLVTIGFLEMRIGMSQTLKHNVRKDK